MWGMRTRVASGTVSRAQAERCSGVRPQEALKELREIREETGAELDVPQAQTGAPDSPWDVCVFITAGASTKLFAWGGGDTTSRGLCG